MSLEFDRKVERELARAAHLKALEDELDRANGLLDQVQALADISPMRVDIGFKLDVILSQRGAKQREVKTHGCETDGGNDAE